MIVAGLIQLHSSDRVSCEEIYSLLKEFKEKINNFHSFHMRKTAFQNIFKYKLNALDVSIDRIKQESNA
jgi:NAD(P)H-flavin reductase